MCMIKSILEFIGFQKYYALPQTKATFKALVDTIIPKTSKLVQSDTGNRSYENLVDSSYQYIIWSLNFQLSIRYGKIYFNINLANATAKMLDLAAVQLIRLEGKDKRRIKKVTFRALSITDRLRAIQLLEQCRIDLSRLPIPFRNAPDLVLSIVDAINMFSTLGYYSEWTGYGRTRMEKPCKRKLQYFPICWEQIGYPGPSKGYRSLRREKKHDR